jgi:gluconolactonase
LGQSSVFADCSAGLFDGFRFDREDRIWSSTAEGVHCFTSDGSLIGKILIPEIVANLCLGGETLNRLFIAGTTSLYAVYLGINGR